jgi:type VI protein secretion system component VasK
MFTDLNVFVVSLGMWGLALLIYLIWNKRKQRKEAEEIRRAKVAAQQEYEAAHKAELDEAYRLANPEEVELPPERR